MSRPKYQGIQPRRSASVREKLDWYSMPEPNSGCQLWLGGGRGDGYGALRTDRQDRAHRVAWREYRGPIPDGMYVLHKCDVRCCINPDHLWLGTHNDNMADMARKGRCPSYRGEKHPRAKLTDVQRGEIARDTRSQRVIANLYGVAPSLVSVIKSAASRITKP